MRLVARQIRREGGLTLVELLVSLALLGTVAAMAAGGLGTVRRVWERGTTGIEGQEAVEGAQTILRLRLEGLFPATRFDGSAPASDFLGTATTAEFLAPPSDALGRGALRRYSLALQADGSLTLRSVNDVWRNLPGPVREEVLLRGVHSVDLAYFGAAPPDNLEQWRANWRGRPTPPKLVRVRVRFPPGDRRWWPDLIARPRTSVDTACVLVLNSDGARCQGW